MKREAIGITPIGIIHSPYKERGDAPFQGRLADTVMELELYPEYLPGLKDIDQVSHIIVLYWGDRSRRDVLQVQTPFVPELKGVFACRAPDRPNTIALCVAELLKVEGALLTVHGVDALDGSPLLDIKPYSSKVDCMPEAKIGWLPEE